jgi:DNA-binding response OmpR family regulator
MQFGDQRAMGSEKRVLVVDDDDAIRALVGTVLRRRGLAVDAARNGVEALARIRLCRYSVVVLDLMMPLMSGFDVLDHIGTLATDRRPYVLVLTAGLEPRNFDSSFVIGTIHKPFDISLLLDTVTGVLRSSPGFPQPNGCVQPDESGLDEPN